MANNIGFQLGQLIRPAISSASNLGQQLVNLPQSTGALLGEILAGAVTPQQNTPQLNQEKVQQAQEKTGMQLDALTRIRREEGEKALRKLIKTGAENDVNVDPGTVANFIDNVDAQQSQSVHPQQATRDMETAQLIQNLLAQQQSQQMTQGPTNPIEGLLQGLAQPFETQRLQNVIRQQQIAGEVPLQKGEREKIELQGLQDMQKEQYKALLDARSELLETQNPDALKGENAVKFLTLREGRNAVVDIDRFLGESVNSAITQQKLPEFLKSQTAKRLQSAIEQAVQTKTRIETGAALQPSELKSTAKRFMPRVGDSMETAQSRLRTLFDFFDGAIKVMDPTGIHFQRATGQTMQQANSDLQVFGVKQIG